MVLFIIFFGEVVFFKHLKRILKYYRKNICCSPLRYRLFAFILQQYIYVCVIHRKYQFNNYSRTARDNIIIHRKKKIIKNRCGERNNMTNYKH